MTISHRSWDIDARKGIRRLWMRQEVPWQVKLIKRGWRSDPVTLAVLTAVIGTTAVVGGAGAGIAALSGAFDSKQPENTSSASGYTAASTDTGAVSDVGSIEEQAAQRKLARLSKYFTSPTGVLDVPTGTTGVF